MEPYPSLHTCRLNSRTAMFYVAALVTPAMCVRLTNAGSQHLPFFDKTWRAGEIDLVE